MSRLARPLGTVLGLGVLSLLSVLAFPAPPEFITVRSRSGQFIVVAPARLPVPPSTREAATNHPLNLTADLAAVSCERVKEALLMEFGLRSVFAEATRNRPTPLHIRLVASTPNTDNLAFTVTRYLDGWNYQLQIPTQVHPEPLVRGVVHALLTTWANRNPGSYAAEIPAWLTEGLALHLETVSPLELVLDRPLNASPGPNRLPLRVSLRQSQGSDPLQQLRERLRLRPSLSFTELSLPPNAMEPDALTHYRDSAHLFVAELLKSRDTRESLGRLLELLPQHLNWQTAFYRAFHPRFEQAIDVEKWWALTLVAFTGRDPSQTWTHDLALRKLDDVLRIQAELRQAGRDIPQRDLVSLQQVVANWDRLQQQIALQRVSQQLAAIQLKLPPDLATLAEEYRAVINEFLARRSRNGYASERNGEVPLTAAMLARQTNRRLDDLDLRRREPVISEPVISRPVISKPVTQ